MAESFIRKHYDLAISRWKAGDGGEIVHDGVISVATGVAVGYAAAHSKNDLEITVAHKRVPVDFAASVGAIVGSLVVSGNKKTRDVLRKAASAGLGISAYRATERYIHLRGGTGMHPLAHHAGHPAVAAHAGETPDMGNDPVLIAAANL
jgi:hypothetical protein